LKNLWDQALRRLGIQISNRSNEFGSEFLASRSIGGGNYDIPEKPAPSQEKYETWETHAQYGYAR
jgi:hypothetical protein